MRKYLQQVAELRATKAVAQNQTTKNIHTSIHTLLSVSAKVPERLTNTDEDTIPDHSILNLYSNQALSRET